ncbi:hypothetical protein CROQUDRAFT_109159 [Cronartium quercuum f. sp. fusiforme G11]|uniref:Uncharacterized protein n=1 Tax=Cronartium quercuum f. sp. fusiforme G11 TaxID=708437 RepID=A0A9P6T8Z3_9BASI|nr:hypothetical protein CROQUDRAFT_109159 [Cronartium quercuum f. sp. fusiforme G11]
MLLRHALQSYMSLIYLLLVFELFDQLSTTPALAPISKISEEVQNVSPVNMIRTLASTRITYPSWTKTSILERFPPGVHKAKYVRKFTRWQRWEKKLYRAYFRQLKLEMKPKHLHGSKPMSKKKNWWKRFTYSTGDFFLFFQDWIKKHFGWICFWKKKTDPVEDLVTDLTPKPQEIRIPASNQPKIPSGPIYQLHKPDSSESGFVLKAYTPLQARKGMTSKEGEVADVSTSPPSAYNSLKSPLDSEFSDQEKVLIDTAIGGTGLYRADAMNQIFDIIRAGVYHKRNPKKTDILADLIEALIPRTEDLFGCVHLGTLIETVKAQRPEVELETKLETSLQILENKMDSFGLPEQPVEAEQAVFKKLFIEACRNPSEITNDVEIEDVLELASWVAPRAYYTITGHWKYSTKGDFEKLAPHEMSWIYDEFLKYFNVRDIEQIRPTIADQLLSKLSAKALAKIILSKSGDDKDWKAVHLKLESFSSHWVHLYD